MTMSHIIRAANLLKTGGLVAFPTETVYGLGADARNKEAVNRIFLAKKRPKTHPLIVHLADVEALSDWARAIPDDAKKLANTFWPGPLTMILLKQEGVLHEITGNQETIALRIPKHPVALALLQAFGGGIAAPSANQFTHVSPTTTDAVREELGDAVDMILEGGPCEIGLESTIIDLSQTIPRILRPGMITHHALEACLGKSVQRNEQTLQTTRAPGMHTLHYAPSTTTLLLSTEEIEQALQNVDTKPTLLLAYHADALRLPSSVHLITLSADPTQYAHELYHTLRAADHLKPARIWIQAVPMDSTWDAIRDRIQKASGQR